MNQYARSESREGLGPDSPGREAAPIEPSGKVVMCLFVAGNGFNSAQARANLELICKEYLVAFGWSLEVVDVLCNPERALAESVFITPMLVKRSPLPARQVAGNLKDRAAVLAALQIGV